MTHEDFNQKYAAWLTIGGKGLEVTLSYHTMQALDQTFQSFIQLPNFKYIHIAYKNGKGYFSAIGVTADAMYAVEQLLTNDKYPE